MGNTVSRDTASQNAKVSEGPAIESDVIVAIDFGTSRSGWGFVDKRNSAVAPFLQTEWNGVRTAYKNATCILYDKTGTKALAWGFAARRQHQRSKDKLFLLENFKMKLCADEDKDNSVIPRTREEMERKKANEETGKKITDLMISGGMQRKGPTGGVSLFRGSGSTSTSAVKLESHKNDNNSNNENNDNSNNSEFTITWSEQGKRWNLVRVIADFLALMKQDIMKVLRDNDPMLTEQQISWIVTVPAIWNEKMKSMMLSACRSAGLVQDWSIDGVHCAFALEPEAAAVGLFDATSVTRVADDTPFMVIDAGGGTIDITVFKRVDGELLQEYRSSGGAAGGKFVDQAFFAFVFGEISKHMLPGRKAAAQELQNRAKDHMCYWQFVREWEDFKEATQGEEGIEETIAFPSADKVLELFRKDLKERPACFDEGGTLSITRAQYEAFFLKPVSRTVEYVLECSKNCPSIKEAVLVGGFASSDLLVEAVRNALAPLKIGVRRVPKPGSAVLLGALCYGRNPQVVLHRKTLCSWGVRTISQSSRESNVYTEIVGANADVQPSQPATRVLSLTLEHNMNGAIIELHTSYSATKPLTTDDAGVAKVAEIVLPATLYMKDGKIAIPRCEVNLFFGRTFLTWNVTVGKETLDGAKLLWEREANAVINHIDDLE